MNRIKELREMLHKQQKELAIDLGVSQPTISDWESGRKIPSARSTQKLADYFDVSVDYLLGRSDSISLVQTFKLSFNPECTEEDSAPEDEDRLSDFETKLLKLYRDLNEEGQEKLLDYADDLVASGKYIKNNEDQLGKTQNT